MRIGDSLKCIDIDRCFGITLNKIYTVLDIDNFGDPLVNNNIGGEEKGSFYMKKRFINISEERRNKLKCLKSISKL